MNNQRYLGLFVGVLISSMNDAFSILSISDNTLDISSKGTYTSELGIDKFNYVLLIISKIVVNTESS